MTGVQTCALPIFVIGGDFTTVNGTSINRVARLSSTDGSLDTTFNPAASMNGGANGLVRTIILDPDSGNATRYVLGGDFTGPSFALAVTSKGLANNVATLTTATAHGFTGSGTETVVVSGVGAPFDGTYTVLASPAPTLTTFSYSRTSANVATAAVNPIGQAGKAGEPVNRAS